MPTLRYVVLRHEGFGESHFDLMFETSEQSKLSTWRSMDWPITPSTRLIYLSEHRRTYLDYEGPVSDNRGHVKRVDQGHHTIQQNGSRALVTQLEDGSILSLAKLNQIGA